MLRSCWFPAWMVRMGLRTPDTLIFSLNIHLRGGPVKRIEVTTFIHFQWKHEPWGLCRPQTVVVIIKSVKDQTGLAIEQAKYLIEPLVGITQDCFLCEVSAGWPTCWHAAFLLNRSWGLSLLAPLCLQPRLWAQSEFYMSYVCVLWRVCVSMNMWP